MATARRPAPRAAARARVLDQLKEDHKRVKKAYRDFQKLDPEDDAEAVQQLVEQVLLELTVHAELEEELLYPAARESIAEEDLVDEAEVEHESMKALIEQLKGMTPEDEKYAARFTVLCEYVIHHVKEEEGEMFPQLEKAKLDWETMAREMDERRAELMPDAEAETAETAETAEMAETAEDADAQPAARAPARSRTRN